ncbi:MAG TPA: Wzz/FepE/Etk N-terminal domain-containing protein [Candidatus Bathyarchaeia archaeon]|nr:Wzz/FepE/Etk N-terminal domain-containing protein [Candidatus Bathyarchaeia archaeon]
MIEDVQGQSNINIEQLVKMFGRRRWWLLLPAFLCWLVVWGVSWVLPTAYESKATILVVQPNVPEQYVMPNVTMSLQEQLASMEQQILSRPRLQTIIDRYHLYQKSTSWLGPVDPVEEMRKDIEIDPLVTPTQSGGRQGDLTAFQILYKAPTARIAQVVDGELTSLFIDENLRSQQQLSQSTTTFLGQQLADARKKLQEQEEKVSSFKEKYLGQLPSQMQSNVQILSGMEGQLQSLQQALDRAQQQKLYLQSLLDQFRTTATVSDNGSPATTPAVLDNEIKQLELQLADARSHYTDNYPDVVALKDRIEKTKKLRDQMVADASAPPKPDVDKSAASTTEAADPQLSQSMMQTQSQLKANQLQIQDYQKQVDALQARIKDYEARLNLTPVREQEFEEISRGYVESEANYSALLKRLNESQLATDLQQQQQGQHFQLIDPPDAPVAPFSPNRILISLGGLAAGVFLGIALTLLKEVTDVRVRQEKDLEDIVSARVLVGIPRMNTSAEVKRQKWLRLAESAAMVLLTLGVVAGNIISFIKG